MFFPLVFLPISLILSVLGRGPGSSEVFIIVP